MYLKRTDLIIRYGGIVDNGFYLRERLALRYAMFLKYSKLYGESKAIEIPLFRIIYIYMRLLSPPRK